MTIVKVQTPVLSNVTDPQSLVYREGRRQQCLIHPNAETVAAMGSDMKAYFEAEWDDVRQVWKIGKRVEDQAW